MKRARWLAIATLGILLAAAPASAATPVLGKRGLFPGGEGWGTAQPKTIFNGGSPSGLADKIRWTGWGDTTARGSGVIAAFRPEGGYYATRVPIQLRASRLGRCPGSSQRAYRRLIFRAHDRPGGAYGDWSAWTLDLCNANAKPKRCGLVAFAPDSDFGAFDITGWDTTCATARDVARPSRDVAIRPGSPAKYRYTANGWICNGYSLDDVGLPSITFTCNRGTAVVGFNRS